MKNLPVLQYGNKTAVEKKDLEVAFHPSLLACECREPCPPGAARDVSEQGKLLLRWFCQTEAAVLSSAGTCSAWEQPWLLCVSQWEGSKPLGPTASAVQELVLIKKSERTKPGHWFLVCLLLSVYSQCLPRGWFYVTTNSLTGFHYLVPEIETRTVGDSRCSDGAGFCQALRVTNYCPEKEPTQDLSPLL